jgi:hypothetical protein
MANNVVRARSGQQMWSPPAVGTRDGNWIWDGSNWVCDPGCDDGGGFPPFGPPVFSGPVGQPPWYPGANGGVSFGQTAPANPVRGHFWYDGATLWIFDGAAWDAVGGTGASGGTATGSTPPASPFNGQLWFNGSTLYVWDGNAWVPTSTTKSFVQATAPPAPNPGDLWFDGTVQRIWSGTAWVLVGPGATIGPVPTTTQVFSVQTVSQSPITASAWDIAPINGTPGININGNWNVTTKQWTPAVAGMYYYQILGWNPSGIALLSLAKNDSGGPYADLTTMPIVAAVEVTQAQWLFGNGITHMNGTTDFVRLWAYNSAGTFGQSYGQPTLMAFLLP